MRTSPQYITRIDQPAKNTFGWYARFPHGEEKYSKLFSDKKNGGKDQAFIAAQKWVSETRKELGLKYGESTNSSGYPGIYELKTENRIIAVWKTPEGKIGQTSRSLTNHKRKDAIAELVEIQRLKNKGKDQAFIAAKKWVSKTMKGVGLKCGEKKCRKNKNSTGFPGIYELKTQNRIIAEWKTPEGKSGQTSRSLTNNKRKDAIKELVEIQRQKNRGE